MPSAFVNTDVDEDVIMVLKGELADMMIQIAPKVYRKYVTADRKGTPILYVKRQKALYGLMRASLLFYRKLRKEFERYGLVINPYDPCVANMETKSGIQLTVVWHMDDLMASCEDDFELTKFSCHMGGIYGPNLSMHLGKKHDYLRVDMEFCDDGALEVSMFKYLKNVIDEFPELIRGRAATLEHEKLFVIRDKKEARRLNKEQALAFHQSRSCCSWRQGRDDKSEEPGRRRLGKVEACLEVSQRDEVSETVADRRQSSSVEVVC